MDEEIDWSLYNNKTPLFNLNDYCTTAYCVNVYDGDTIKLIFKFRDHFDRWNCRLSGIDTPELRSHKEYEKELAIIARDKLKEMILDKIVYIKCGYFDKYGRLLIDIYTKPDNLHINSFLINEGFAKSYDGGTKSSW